MNLTSTINRKAAQYQGVIILVLQVLLPAQAQVSGIHENFFGFDILLFGFYGSQAPFDFLAIKELANTGSYAAPEPEGDECQMNLTLLPVPHEQGQTPTPYQNREINIPNTREPPLDTLLHLLNLTSGEHKPLQASEETLAVFPATCQDFYLLLDIDEEGYAVIIVVEMESGKPARVKRIQTGLHCYSSEFVYLLNWVGKHKGVRLTENGDRWLRLSDQLQMVFPDETGVFHWPGSVTSEQALNEQSLNESYSPLLTPNLSQPSAPSGSSEPDEEPAEKQDKQNTDDHYDIEKIRNNLIFLVENLKSRGHYTGFFTNILKSQSNLNHFVRLLPPRFLWLVRNFPETLFNYPDELLTNFLRLSTFLTNEPSPQASAVEALERYFDTLLLVFDHELFVPLPGLSPKSRTDMFKELTILDQIVWQRNMESDFDLSWLGMMPATNPEIIALVALRHNYAYTLHSSPKAETARATTSKRVRNPFVSPWKKQAPNTKVVNIILERYNTLRRERQIANLQTLNSGFYSVGVDNQIIHVAMSCENSRHYTLYAGSGIFFSFDKAELFYDFLLKNYCLFILLYPLAFKPVHFQEKRSACHWLERNLTEDEHRALDLFGLTTDDLKKPDQINVDSLYRKLAATRHPDKGGDRQDFDELYQSKKMVEDLIRRNR